MGLETEILPTCLFVQGNLLENGKKSPWYTLAVDGTPNFLASNILRGKIVSLKIKEVAINETSRLKTVKQKLDCRIDDKDEKVFIVRTGLNTWFARTLINSLNTFVYEDFNKEIKLRAKVGEGSTVFCNIFKENELIKYSQDESFSEDEHFSKIINISQMIDAANGRNPAEKNQIKTSENEDDIPF